jgi:hypothetical protein
MREVVGDREHSQTVNRLTSAGLLRSSFVIV